MRESTLAYRMAKVEERVCQIDAKIERIMEDHIPDLKSSINNIELKIMQLKTKINVFTAFNIGAIVVAIIVGYLMK